MTNNRKTADGVGVDEGESLLVQGDLSKSENLLGGAMSEKENDVLDEVGKIMSETEPAPPEEPTPSAAVEKQHTSSLMVRDDVLAPEKDDIAPEMEMSDFVLFADNDFYEAESSFEESFFGSPQPLIAVPCPGLRYITSHPAVPHLFL